ncbi:MAG: YggS family pyridoxal phosphate-dependent enzyme [Bacteroidia bacterium]
MSIKSALQSIDKELKPFGAQLVAVSKTHSTSAIKEAYACGQRIFGESTAQELVTKQESLPNDISWHFIGHLQSNKVKYIAPFVQCIHAVDTEKLLQVIDKEAGKNGRKIDCLLQLHIAQEESKYGFSPAELRDFLASGQWQSFKHVRIIGLMCIASNTENENRLKEEFELMASLLKEFKAAYFAHAPYFKELSMGMSGDYLLAMHYGASLIRIGSAIFGSR